MSNQDTASDWFVPTVATDGFPAADNSSTVTLASSVFATTRSGVKLDGWQFLSIGAGTATVVFKNTAGATLFTIAAGSIGTSGAARTNNYGPNGLKMGAGFSVNVGVDATASIIVWYRIL
jgi:hypothetical protein